MPGRKVCAINIAYLIGGGRESGGGDLSVIPNALYTFTFFCCRLCLCNMQTCNFLSDLIYAIVSSRIFLDIMWAVVVYPHVQSHGCRPVIVRNV